MAKILDYNSFLTFDDLVQLSDEDYETVKENVFNIKSIITSKQLDSYTLKTVYSFTPIDTSDNYIHYFAFKQLKNKDFNDVIISLIECKILINNSEMFVDLLLNNSFKIDLSKIKYILGNVKQIKEKLQNNIPLNDNDIKFNDWLNNFSNYIIRKYYPNIDERLFINKLTDSFIFERELISSKQKTL